MALIEHLQITKYTQSIGTVGDLYQLVADLKADSVQDDTHITVLSASLSQDEPYKIVITVQQLGFSAE